eukprot:4694264-Amphidinium_carterae.1
MMCWQLGTSAESEASEMLSAVFLEKSCQVRFSCLQQVRWQESACITVAATILAAACVLPHAIGLVSFPLHALLRPAVCQVKFPFSFAVDRGLCTGQLTF